MRYGFGCAYRELGDDVISCRLYGVTSALILALMGVAGGENESPDSSPNRLSIAHEYEVKTAFVYNMAKLVEWPADTWHSPGEPIRFGFLGEQPSRTLIKKSFTNRTAQGRPVEAYVVATVEEMRQCHVLFVHRDEYHRLPIVARAIRGRPVLLVTDTAVPEPAALLPISPRPKPVVHFVVVDGKVRFQINPEAAREAGLVISSKLLRLSWPVDLTKPKPSAGRMEDDP